MEKDKALRQPFEQIYKDRLNLPDTYHRVQELTSGAPPFTRPLGEGGQIIYRHPNFNLNRLVNKVSKGNETQDITKTQSSILATLLENRNRVATYDELLVAAWGENAGGTGNSLRVYVSTIRMRLKQIGADPSVIRSVNGVGYILDDTSEVIKEIEVDRNPITREVKIYSHPDFKLYIEGLKAVRTKKEEIVFFKKREVDILEVLAKNENQLVTYDELIESVWENPEDIDRFVLNSHVASIRGKVWPGEKRNRTLATVINKGFILHNPDTLTPGSQQ